MPLNIWTTDQSPQLQLAGGQAMAGGIAGFGQSLGAAIERYSEEKKKREEELKRVLASDKAMMGFVAALPEETAAEMGLPSKLDLSAMKAGEPTAIVSGAFKALGARETLGNLKNQLAQRDAAQRAAENDRRRQLAMASLVQQGQSPGSIPGPFSNEEFDRRTSPLNPQAFLQAMGQQGAMPESVDVSMMKMLADAQPTAPRGLPLGEVRKLPGIGSIVGTGEPFEPNFVAERPPGDTKVLAPSYPWLFTDDEEELKAGLRSITKPEERDAALSARAAFNRAVGKDDPLREALAHLLNPDKAKAGAKPKGTAAPSGGSIGDAFDAWRKAQGGR